MVLVYIALAIIAGMVIADRILARRAARKAAAPKPNGDWFRHPGLTNYGRTLALDAEANRHAKAVARIHATYQ